MGTFSLPIQSLLQEFFEPIKKPISGVLYMECFLIRDMYLVFAQMPNGFDLQDIGIHLSLPKPLGTSKLDIFWVNCRYFRQILKKHLSVFASF